ncbi:hypothetical protein D1872_335300 [compost metagenome]
MDSASAKIVPGAEPEAAATEASRTADAGKSPAAAPAPAEAAGQVVNPLTGQIPVSRKERRAFEELMKQAPPKPND